MTTTDITPLPEQVEHLAIVHLGAAYAAQVLHAGDTEDHVKGLRAALYVANAAAAYLLQTLADTNSQAATDAASYIDDAFTDPEHLHDWVTEQLIGRGIDLSGLAEAARASAALGQLARDVVAADTIEKITEVHNHREVGRVAKSTVTVRGYSDDLIGIGGDLTEEFDYRGRRGEGAAEGDLLAFPDGTVLRIAYTRAGIWRITPVHRGHGILTINQATEDEDEPGGYSDTATINFTTHAVWALHGRALADLRPAGRR